MVYTYDLQAILWVRYIDNISGVTSLKRFIHHLNSVHPTLKFTAVWSEHQITVLDVLIKLNQNGTLTTDLYVKPTDAHMYLHYSSCHHKNQKDIGPYSQLIRVQRICSDISDFELHANIILIHYKSRGYPASILTEALTKARALNRDSLLARRLTNRVPSHTTLGTHPSSRF